MDLPYPSILGHAKIFGDSIDNWQTNSLIVETVFITVQTLAWLSGARAVFFFLVPSLLGMAIYLYLSAKLGLPTGADILCPAVIMLCLGGAAWVIVWLCFGGDLVLVSEFWVSDLVRRCACTIAVCVIIGTLRAFHAASRRKLIGTPALVCMAYLFPLSVVSVWAALPWADDLMGYGRVGTAAPKIGRAQR